ncbi:MAG: enolase C-terminal domain-like protein [bacterium]|jgi:mannonate dehydratase
MMKRRDLMGMLAMGGAALGSASVFQEARAYASEKVDQIQTKAMEPIKITDVKVVLTAPEGIRLVVVKVETSDPGLYGWGCATFTQRPLVVKTAVEEYLRPFLIGKNPDAINDLYQSMYVSSYWRNGPVLNNAISGVEMALWDIKGKRAGMPVYQLLGGKARFAADLYAHAGGRNFEQVLESVQRWQERGYRNIRAQYSSRVGGTYGSGRFNREDYPELPEDAQLFDPQEYTRQVPKMFEYLRDKLGYEINLLHDTHERVTGAQALYLGKALEPFQLFFWEDPTSPEDVEHFRIIRQQCATPLAMGELFNNINEWLDLVKERLIDFIRVHISQIGGVIPAMKLAHFCDYFGIQTAWHGPGDNSPIGHAANVAIDVVVPNFGIQEQHIFNEKAQEVFQGCLRIENGYAYPNEAPGWGIEVDEEAAKKFPYREDAPFDFHWGQTRKPDGSIIKP